MFSSVRLFATPWTAACQACLSNTNSRSLLKFMSTESVMPSNHLILCHPLLLLPSIFPNIRVFPKESALCIRWPKYWSFSFIISPSNEHSGLISFSMDWSDLERVWPGPNCESHYSCIKNTLCGRVYCFSQLLDHFLNKGGHPCSLSCVKCLTDGALLHSSSPLLGFMGGCRM